MHSSRMYIVRCSGRLRGGGVCPDPEAYTIPPPPGVDRQTDNCKNIILPQLLLRTVNIEKKESLIHLFHRFLQNQNFRKTWIKTLNAVVNYFETSDTEFGNESGFFISQPFKIGSSWE